LHKRRVENAFFNFLLIQFIMKKYAIFFLFILLTSCSGVKVLNVETGENVDFAKYKTFDFYKLSASGDTISKLYTARIDLLKEAISAELSKRGFTQSAGNTDMLVNIGIKIKEEVQTRTTDWRTDGAPKYIGQRNYSWKSEDVEVGRYREGTVSLHLVDAGAKKMVWKGAIQGVVPEKNSNVQEAIQNAMKELFEKFPVEVKK
jgi:hypothetical protein